MYQAYADYNDMMDLTEKLICQTCKLVQNSLDIVYQGVEISLHTPWRRVTMSQLVFEASNFDFEKCVSLDEAKQAAINAGVRSAANKESIGEVG